VNAKRDLAVIRAEIATLEIALRRAQRLVSLPPRHRIDAACREILEGQPESFEDRRAVLEEVVSEVRYADDEVEIQARLPLDGSKNCHSNVCSDSQRQRQCGYREKAPVLRQLARRVPKVFSEVFQPVDTSFVAALFGNSRHTPETPITPGAGLLRVTFPGGHPARSASRCALSIRR